MTNPRELLLLSWDYRELQNGMEPSAKILALVAGMNIEHLRVSAVWIGSLTRQICCQSAKAFSALRCLTVAGIFAFGDDGKLPAHLHHTSSLECVKFTGSNDAKCMAELLKWPRALKSIDAGLVLEDSRGTFQQAIDIHSWSLEQVVVRVYYGSRGDEDDNTPDLARFSWLRRVTLGANMTLRTPPDRAAAKLSCSLLTSLYIKLDAFYAHTLPSQDKLSAKWIVEFAVVYRETNCTGSLKKINFLCEEPYIDSLTCLAAVRSRMEELGIELTVKICSNTT